MVDSVATQDAAGAVSAPEPVSGTLQPMTVLGSGENLFTLPGSGYYVDTDEIRSHSYLSVNRILSKVPGVYTREENGFGLFPNISLRGGDGTRSEKVTIMEDGILTAPAPYAAPSAYYSPNASRMHGLEILKGSSQVRYGPHTTGGVINYLSTPVPQDFRVYQRSTYGTNNTVLTQSSIGDTIDFDGGRFGYLVELWWSRSDGFRDIESAPGFGGSDKTGFDLIEPMVKVFYEPKTPLRQRFEAKYGYTRLDADETYTGLTERDLARTPHRRYAGTYLDNIYTEQHRSYLKWMASPTEDLDLEVAGYYNKFSRNWYKIRKAGGEDLHTVLANPAMYPAAFDNLRLRGEGDLGIRANNRDYEAYGAHIMTDFRFETGPLEHALHVGARYHQDYIRRFQRDDLIIVGDGSPWVDRGRWGSGGNRFQKAQATSLWIEDKVTSGPFSVKPGLRYEYVDLEYTDYESDPTNTITGFGSGNTSILAPGVGLTYEITDSQTLFGGVYKGVSAPSPRNYLRSGVDWEESIGYELGARHRGENGLYAELTGFYTDFDNLVGTAAGLGQDGVLTSNAGAAEVYGVELYTSYDFNPTGEISVPVFFSGTYTHATLENALASGGGDDILAGGHPGAWLPYVPEWKLAAGIGLDAGRWGLDLLGSYQSDTFGTARNLSAPDDSSRQGKIDGGFLVDLSAFYRINHSVKVVGGVQNLLDETLTTSRIPEGPRSNAPRTFYIGFEIDWGGYPSPEPGATGGGKSPVAFVK